MPKRGEPSGELQKWISRARSQDVVPRIATNAGPRGMLLSQSFRPD
jgi:hypothetical protein